MITNHSPISVRSKKAMRRACECAYILQQHTLPLLSTPLKESHHINVYNFTTQYTLYTIYIYIYTYKLTLLSFFSLPLNGCLLLHNTVSIHPHFLDISVITHKQKLFKSILLHIYSYIKLYIVLLYFKMIYGC
jgi:hypothetical protein